jgi:uncharacterized membrane protein
MVTWHCRGANAMFSRLSRFLVLAGLFSLAVPTASLAEFAVCNKASNKEIYVALGHYRDRVGWQSEGWYTVKRGECMTLLSKMTDRYYYLYADTENGDTWNGEGSEGSTTFCVQDGNAFTLDVAALSPIGDNPDCKKHSYEARSFKRIDTEGYEDYTYTFND